MTAARLTLAAAFLAAPLGCASTQPKSQLYEAVGHGSLSLGALRIIIRDCARRFPAVLEQEATTIAEGPTTPQQRKGLTEFKANGVPLVQSVLLQQDPVAALIDGWALLYQLRDFLRHGAIDHPRLPETVRTVEGLADELAAVWAATTGRKDVSPTRARIEAWASAHPLRGSLLARDSTAPLLAGILGRGQFSVVGAAGTALENVEEGMARLDLYAINLPRQARWQAEAAVQDLAMSPQVEGVLASLNHALELAAPMSDLAADAGEIVGRERAAFIAGIDRERTALEHFVRDERRAFMAEVASERHAALQEAAAVGHSLVDRAFDRLQQVLLRVAFAVALGLAAVLLVWFLVSRGRRRGIPAPSARARQSATLTEREA